MLGFPAFYSIENDIVKIHCNDSGFLFNREQYCNYTECFLAIVNIHCNASWPFYITENDIVNIHCNDSRLFI